MLPERSINALVSEAGSISGAVIPPGGIAFAVLQNAVKRNSPQKTWPIIRKQFNPSFDIDRMFLPFRYPPRYRNA
jgi:hypothetical protein